MAKPEANEAAVDISEETVNYVAEFVYDTQLQNHEIHQTIWAHSEIHLKKGLKNPVMAARVMRK